MVTKKVKTSSIKKKKKPKHVEHPLSSETEFTNRELGWLHFNRRVLHEAQDQRNPLLERLRFLQISHSNLDEFFMKRVGGLKRQVASGVTSRSSDGKTPAEQLKMIRHEATLMLKEQSAVYSQQLKPALDKLGVSLLSWKQLQKEEKDRARQYYLKNIFPVLTPLSVDPGHPFPFISNLSLSLAVTLRPPESDERHFARLKIPQALPQWICVSATGTHPQRFVSLLEIIKENLSDLFPSMHVSHVMPFRLTRNADISRDEEDAEDLLSLIEEELKMRRFAEVVRLEHGPHPDPGILQFLMEELELHDEDIYLVPESFEYLSFQGITELPLKGGHFPLWNPVVPSVFSDDSQSIFQLLRRQDYLVHHPYESFHATVEKFIRKASEDPKVLAIKMTLYRTGDQSPFIRALIHAAESGKQVVCLIELKARFDEQRNIYWAQELENAGVHVVYGIVGLKTHAKTALVVRQESDGLRCYAHIGTGNYNAATSRFYTDLGLLTAREEITSELVDFFHYLTGRSLKNNYNYLLIAPVNMFSKFKALIDIEAENARKGLPSGIIAKMNNMEENDISIALYNASQCGVGIDLLVRGFCCLRPGVPGLSEKIRVLSTIGRFLEHSRIFYFRHGAEDPLDGLFFIGSADWMYRNLHSRVEAVVPILDRSLREKIWEILQLMLKDQRQTWEMNSEGQYKQRSAEGSSDSGVQQQLMQLALQRNTLQEDNS